MPLMTQKLAVSGRLLELYSYEKPIPYDFERVWTKQGPREKAKEASNIDPSTQSAGFRAKAKFRRLCFANSWEWNRPHGEPTPPIFNTYTFRDNVTDPKIAHAEFTKAMERLNYQWRDFIPNGLKYVVVPERQKRGAIHYHQLAFNLPYIPRIYGWLNDIWGQGYILVKTANASRMLFSYIGKYLTKDMASARQFNGKRYFASRGLLQPTVFRKDAHIHSLLDLIPPNVPFWQPEKPAENERLGKIYYRRYLLPKAIPLEPVEKLFDVTTESQKPNDDAILPMPTDTPDEGPDQELPVDNPI